MNEVIVLDTGVLGILARRSGIAIVDRCNSWLERHLSGGARVIVPEICDYELRRELIRLDFSESIERLDALCAALEYLPLTTQAMRRAAFLWAQVRKEGRPTAGKDELNGDVILAAQALELNLAGTVVATTNVGHLSRFLAAQTWDHILPSIDIEDPPV